MSGLGDAVHKALELVGVTEDRVARWLGHSCAGCKRRQEKLNELGWWAGRVLKGKVDLIRGKKVLEETLVQDDPKTP